MARKKSAQVAANAETAVLDYRHDEAKRKNIPPAGLAAQGKVRETLKIWYAYDAHLPPVLRFDPAGRRRPSSCGNLWLPSGKQPRTKA
jgi:adenine-specific DNA-methyltransferase